MNDEARSQLKILIVDDESENAEAYARALRGYQLLRASRGDEALSVLAEHTVDIVVTDQRMPGLSGASLLQRARAVNPMVRRIVVSASSSPEHLLEAINFGEVERYLLKPVEPEKLRSVVDELADQYLLMQAHGHRIGELQDQLHSLRRVVQEPDDGELLDRAELELVRARRYRRPLALLVWGGAGEVDLKKWRAELRELDIAMRIGDRVVVLLPESDRTGALSVWERLRTLGELHPPAIRSCPEDGTTLQALLLSIAHRV